MKLLLSPPATAVVAAAAACCLLLQLEGAQGSPDRECPPFFYENGFVADAGLLSDAVRWKQVPIRGDAGRLSEIE